MEKLKIGFIGAGFAARFHLRGLVGVRNADVVAVVSRTEKTAKEFVSLSEQLGFGRPRIYTNVDEFLADKEINAVWIITPNDTHLSYAKRIAEEVRQSSKTNIIGVAIEKPLARNVKEAKEMINSIEKAGLLHGYLENQVFMPSIQRAKEVIWNLAAKYSSRPYLARAAEEHGGPHNDWFWRPTISGGGALIDMSCHSLEASRHLLLDPSKDKNSLRPKYIMSFISTLKWLKKEYVEQLKQKYSVDFSKEPAEDYALTLVQYEDEDGNIVLSEARTSWSFIGAGLRLSMEVLGPEYSVFVNSQNQELSAFISRNVKVPPSEMFIEKQNADQGLMPVIPDEAVSYGYQAEDRHMVESFLNRRLPYETWYDGLLVVQLMMHAYKSAEEGRRLEFNESEVENYIPKVSQGLWRPLG